MTVIVGISGSLRRHSYNAGLLRAAQAATPAGARLDIGSIAEFPLYNADIEAEGTPPAVVTLGRAIAAADGVLLVTPEYNNGIPGVFKNAIDWLSSASGSLPPVFDGKKVALMGASATRFGTILSQNAWLPVLRTLGVDFWSGGRLMAPQARNSFSETGELIDEEVRARVATFMAGFVAHLQRT